MGVTLLLVACTGTSTGDSATSDSAAWIAAAEERPEPTSDIAELESVLQSILDDLLSYSAGELITRYDGWLEGADDNCPVWSERELTEIWTAACTSDAGIEFRGTGTSTLESYTQEDYATDEREVEAAAEFTGPDSALSFEGTATTYVHEYSGGADEHVLHQAYLSGRFSGSNTGTWLDQGATLDLKFRARATSGHSETSISGSIAGLPGPYSAVEFTGLSRNTASGCSEEGGGEVALRDADGYWYQAAFDGDEDNWGSLDATHPGCDGCAALSYAGVSLGELCLDTAPLTDWLGSPW